MDGRSKRSLLHGSSTHERSCPRAAVARAFTPAAAVRAVPRWLGVAIAAAFAFTPAAAARLNDVRYVVDDFESPNWPAAAVWSLPTAATTWRPSECQALGGRRALRAFAPSSLTHDTPWPCDAVVPPGAAATAFLHLDLRAAGAANRLELGFDVWFRLNAAVDAGLVLWLRVPRADGGADRVPVFGATGDGGAWASPQRYLDLRNLSDVRDPAVVFDLRGAAWTLEWTATAPAGAPAGGGVYVDNVALTWEPDRSYPTPTRLPTLPPTATRPSATTVRTATPTDEPTPTDVPFTATATAPAGRAYLPLLRHDPQPTATATATLTATATVTGTATMTGTMEPGGTPLPGETATAHPGATAAARRSSTLDPCAIIAAARPRSSVDRATGFEPVGRTFEPCRGYMATRPDR